MPFPPKEVLKIEDICWESTVLLAVIIIFISLLMLRTPYRHSKSCVIAVIGTGLCLGGALLDLLDEFYQLPQILPRVIENGLIAVGLLLLSLGMAMMVRQLIGTANTDYLTGLYNKNHFIQVLKSEINRAIRYGLPLSILFLDLDGFKGVNDSLGHRTGDLVLVELAQRIGTTIRSTDLLARYGGDEFVIIMPNSNSSDAESLLRRIKKTLLEMDLPGQQKIGISGGIACVPEDGDNINDLIDVADERMYREKLTH